MTDKKGKKDFSCYTYSEVKTGGGQLVKFTCRPEDVEKIKSFLAENVKRIDISVTGQVNVPHGGFGRYTRYEIIQHKYAGGGHGPSHGGFIEVLEIKNPPDNRHGVVIYEFLNGRGVFAEWETLNDAKAAFEKGWHRLRDNKEFFNKLPGFIRRIECGFLQPWFYAIGDEQFVGDFAFPEGLQDDPIYRFGRKFVVTDYEGYAEIKTCMGVRFVQEETQDFYGYSHDKRKPEVFRLICWDDGTITRDDCHRCNLKGSRLLEEGEMWITDALIQFRKMLAGKTERFEINFTDGRKFVGKVLNNGNKAKCPQGRYVLRVYLKGQKKPEEGYVDFTPTPKFPDVIICVEQNIRKQGKEVERIEITDKQVERGGKKWSGVFHKLPQ